MVNLREMMRLRVPIIAAVIGRGGSGGGLGIGVAEGGVDPRERLLLSDEPGSVFRNFVERSASRCRSGRSAQTDCARFVKGWTWSMKLFLNRKAAHLAINDTAAANLGAALRQNLERIMNIPVRKLLKKRYKKFRALGNFAEGKATSTAAHS